MIVNRSVPSATIIPVLNYSDVAEASAWLCDVFGFTERLRIGDHRAQLVYGDGAVILTASAPTQDSGFPQTSDSHSPRPTWPSHSIHVRVEDAANHHERAVQRGATIISPPTDYPFGERQYTAEDLGGHRWTFSQSIADVDHSSWGATLPDNH